MLIDLSHTVEDGLETYPGLPTPVVGAHRSHGDPQPGYAPGTHFHIGRIDMVSNTGTYLDTPFHRFADGADLAAVPLTSVADLPGVLCSPESRVIGPEALPEVELSGSAVLFETGWSRHWGTPDYFAGHPFLTGAAARELVRRGVALVGIDSLNIDDTSDAERPVHTALLAAGIPIVEHLTNLDAIPPGAFRFFAPPVKVGGMGTFPVRAFALIEAPRLPDAERGGR
ncbi:MAG: cyclase family protein [Myxococcota bacterium]